MRRTIRKADGRPDGFIPGIASTDLEWANESRAELEAALATPLRNGMRLRGFHVRLDPYTREIGHGLIASKDDPGRDQTGSDDILDEVLDLDVLEPVHRLLYSRLAWGRMFENRNGLGTIGPIVGEFDTILICLDGALVQSMDNISSFIDLMLHNPPPAGLPGNLETRLRNVLHDPGLPDETCGDIPVEMLDALCTWILTTTDMQNHHAQLEARKRIEAVLPTVAAILEEQVLCCPDLPEPAEARLRILKGVYPEERAS